MHIENQKVLLGKYYRWYPQYCPALVIVYSTALYVLLLNAILHVLS